MLIRDRAAAALAADPIHSTLGLTPEQQRLFTWAWSAGYAEGLADRVAAKPPETAPESAIRRGCGTCVSGALASAEGPCGACWLGKNFPNWTPKPVDK